MRRATPWILALVLLAGWMATVYGYRQRAGQVASLERKVAQEEQTAKAAEVKLAKAYETIAREEEQAKASARKAEEAARAQRAAADGNPAFFSFDTLRKDPAYAPILRRQQLRAVERMYGDILDKLPPEQRARARELLAEKQEAMLDARDAARAEGLSGSDLSQAVKEAAGEVDAEIKSLVGDDVAAQLARPHPSLEGVRQMISNEVGIDLRIAGQPLNSEQLSALAQVYVNVPSSLSAAVKSSSAVLTARNQALADGAASVLTAEQLAVYRQVLLDNQQQQQIMQRILSAQRSARRN